VEDHFHEAWLRGDHHRYDLWRAQEHQHDFPSFCHELRSFDADVLDEALGMCAAQASRLLLVDGEVWVETGPPCVEVRFTPWTARAEIETRPLGDFYDNDPTSVRFPVTADRDEVDAFIARISPPGTIVADYRVPFDAPSKALMDFDYRRDRIARFGYFIATACGRVRASDRARKIELTESEAETVKAAHSESWKTNPILGTRGDVETHIPVLINIAGRYSRKHPFYLTWTDHLRSTLCSDIRDLLENLPIDIHTL
jgi:hypothetical protein